MNAANFYKEITIKPAGQSQELDIAGKYFRVTKGAAPFLMALDGGTWFQFEKGLRLGPLAQSFQSVGFRSLDTATADNLVGFYYGDVVIDDSRLSVLDENEAAVNTRPVRTQVSTLNSGNYDMDPDTEIYLPGSMDYWTGFKLVTLRRAWLQITNMSDTRTLDYGQNYQTFWGAVFPRSSTPLLPFTDGIIISNNTGGNIPVRIMEVFHLVY